MSCFKKKKASSGCEVIGYPKTGSRTKLPPLGKKLTLEIIK